MNDKPTEELDSVIRDELLRQRVRELTGPPKPSTLWERLTKHSLAPIVTGFLLTGVLGAAISQCTAERQRERDRVQAERERRRAELQPNLAAVQDYARLVSERHTRATMLYDALRRGADSAEVRAARRAYDDVKVRWGSNQQASGLFIRRMTNSTFASPIERAVYRGTGPLYARIDSLLWTASRGPGGQVAPALAELPRLLEASENCGARIADLLYQEVWRRAMSEQDTLMSGISADAVDELKSQCVIQPPPGAAAAPEPAATDTSETR